MWDPKKIVSEQNIPLNHPQPQAQPQQQIQLEIHSQSQSQSQPQVQLESQPQSQSQPQFEIQIQPQPQLPPELQLQLQPQQQQQQPPELKFSQQIGSDSFRPMVENSPKSNNQEPLSILSERNNDHNLKFIIEETEKQSDTPKSHPATPTFNLSPHKSSTLNHSFDETYLSSHNSYILPIQNMEVYDSSGYYEQPDSSYNSQVTNFKEVQQIPVKIVTNPHYQNQNLNTQPQEQPKYFPGTQNLIENSPQNQFPNFKSQPIPSYPTQTVQYLQQPNEGIFVTNPSNVIGSNHHVNYEEDFRPIYQQSQKTNQEPQYLEQHLDSSNVEENREAFEALMSIQKQASSVINPQVYQTRQNTEKNSNNGQNNGLINTATTKNTVENQSKFASKNFRSAYDNQGNSFGFTNNVKYLHQPDYSYGTEANQFVSNFKSEYNQGEQFAVADSPKFVQQPQYVYNDIVPQQHQQQFSPPEANIQYIQNHEVQLNHQNVPPIQNNVRYLQQPPIEYQAGADIRPVYDEVILEENANFYQNPQNFLINQNIQQSQNQNQPTAPKVPVNVGQNPQILQNNLPLVQNQQIVHLPPQQLQKLPPISPPPPPVSSTFGIKNQNQTVINVQPSTKFNSSTTNFNKKRKEGRGEQKYSGSAYSEAHVPFAGGFPNINYQNSYPTPPTLYQKFVYANMEKPKDFKTSESQLSLSSAGFSEIFNSATPSSLNEHHSFPPSYFTKQGPKLNKHHFEKYPKLSNVKFGLNAAESIQNFNNVKIPLTLGDSQKLNFPSLEHNEGVEDMFDFNPDENGFPLTIEGDEKPEMGMLEATKKPIAHSVSLKITRFD